MDYITTLQELIIGNNLTSLANDYNLDKYIVVFSFYMHTMNDAYKYNAAYLEYEHKKFTEFLVSASEKCELLRNIIQEIRDSRLVQNFITQRSIEEVNSVKVYLNDFLESNLNGTIALHESLSFSGAVRNSYGDVITISYNHKQVRSCKVFENTCGEHKYASIVKMAEQVLGLY